MTIQPHKPISPSFGILIILAGMGSALTMAPLFPALPAISAHFAGVPHGEELVRGLITSVSLAFVVGAPLAGFLVERFDLRKLLIGAALLFLISGLSGYFINNLWILLASRVVLGLSETTVSTIVVTLIASRLDPLRRNRWLGWFTVSTALSAFVLIEIGGLVASYDWRAIFLFYLLGLAILLVAAIAVKPASGDDHVEEGAVAGRASAFAIIIPLTLIGIGIGAGAVENTTPIFLPFHLTEIGVSDPSRIARVILPNAAALALSAFFYGHIRRFLSIRMTFVVAFLGAGISLIWLGLLHDYTLMLVASGCLGFHVGLLAPNVYAYSATFGSKDHQARNIGIGRGAFFAGAPMMQVALEPVATSVGAGIALVILGCTSLLLMLWPLARGQRFAEQGADAPAPHGGLAADMPAV